MAFIEQESIEAVAAANNIVDIIGEHVRLKRVGVRFVGLCPFHTEKSPSFHVNPERQTYHCFGCGAGGNIFRFLMQYENLDFPDAVRKLAARSNTPIIEAASSPEQDAEYSLRKRLLALHLEAVGFFQKHLLKSSQAKHARDYLRNRNFNSQVAQRWQIGYAPDSWDSFLQFATTQKFTQSELIASGLVKLRDENNPENGMYDRFRNRLMFPIHNHMGEVIAFSGRALEESDKAAKYVNSPESPIFTKGKVLFGFHKSKQPAAKQGLLILCEGQIDMIRVFEAGIENIAAPQGTAFTEEQAKLIRRITSQVALCYDSDNAGKKAALRTAGILLRHNVEVFIISLPSQQDPDSIIQEQGPEAFQDFLDHRQEFFDYLLESAQALIDPDSPRSQLTAAEFLAPYVALITNPIVQQALITKVTSRLGFAPKSFISLVQKAKDRPDFLEQPQFSNPSAPALQLPPLPLPPPAITKLCQLACQNTDTRNWLLAIHPHTLIAQMPALAPLIKCLDFPIKPDNPATIASFLSSLPQNEESQFSRILHTSLPEWPAQDCWNSIQKQALETKRDALKAQLNTPDLTLEQIIAFQEQILNTQQKILDLQEKLKYVGRLS